MHLSVLVLLFLKLDGGLHSIPASTTFLRVVLMSRLSVTSNLCMGTTRHVDWGEENQKFILIN